VKRLSPEFPSYLLSLTGLLLYTVGFGTSDSRSQLFSTWLVGAASVFWLLQRRRDRRPLLIPIISVPIAALILLLLILTPFSPLPQYGLEQPLRGLALMLALLMVVDSLQRGIRPTVWENALVNLATVFTLIELGIAALWYWRWWTINGSLMPLPPVGYRLTGLFLTHANVMAGYLNLVLPTVLVRLTSVRSWGARGVWAITFLLFLVGEYFTSSRGGWLGAAAGLSVTLLLANLPQRVLAALRRIRATRLRPGLVPILLALAAVASIGLIVLFLDQARSTVHGPISSARSGIWGPALQVIAASPVWGHGPGSFPIHFARIQRLPPGFAANTAHNLWLQIAAESGVLGLLLTAIAAFFLIRAFVRAWRVAPDDARARLAAMAGALVALSVHHLVDDLFQVPGYALAVLVLLALVYHEAPVSEKIRIAPQRLLQLGALMVAAYLGLRLPSFRGSLDYAEGLRLARSGDWLGGATSLCRAAELNPQGTFNGFQCALAQAHVSYEVSEAQPARSAIASLQLPLQTDPYWPLHWANLAALEWRAEHRTAVDHMRRALEAAPLSPEIALNLAWMFEEAGDHEEAVLAYRRALRSDPWLADTVFCQQSAVCREARVGLRLDEHIAAPTRFAWWGFEALSRGSLEIAERNFLLAQQFDKHSAYGYAGLALVYQERGLEELAWKQTQIGLFVAPSQIMLFSAGRVALQQGRLPEAAFYLLSAVRAQQRIHDSYEYYAAVYSLDFLPIDLVPQLQHATLTTWNAEDLARMADLLEEQDRRDDAAELRQYLAEEARP